MLRDVPGVDELTPAQHARYERAGEVIHRMCNEHRLSLTAAARDAGISPREVLQLVGLAFKREGHRWKLRAPDQWPRRLVVIGPNENVRTMVLSPRTVDRIGRHYGAVYLFLETGNASSLRALEGKYIVDGYGIRRYFCTDPATVRRTVSKGRGRFNKDIGIQSIELLVK